METSNFRAKFDLPFAPLLRLRTNGLGSFLSLKDGGRSLFALSAFFAPSVFSTFFSSTLASFLVGGLNEPLCLEYFVLVSGVSGVVSGAVSDWRESVVL